MGGRYGARRKHGGQLIVGHARFPFDGLAIVVSDKVRRAPPKATAALRAPCCIAISRTFWGMSRYPFCSSQLMVAPSSAEAAWVAAASRRQPLRQTSSEMVVFGRPI